MGDGFASAHLWIAVPGALAAGGRASFRIAQIAVSRRPRGLPGGACGWVVVASGEDVRRRGTPPHWLEVRQPLRCVFSSGGPLPFEVSRSAAMVLGQTPVEVFGSSETGGIAWRQCASAEDSWQLFSDVQWRLHDGCLAVCSPRLPDAAWWSTSDRAEPAGIHGFRLLGRADRIVKIEEKRVSLDAMEQQLLKTPW